MSERELFEQRFPVPAGIYWNEISEQYDALPGAAGFDDVEIYHGRWEAWQAARAQGGQGADAVKWSDPAVDPIVSKLYRKFKEWNRQGFGADDVTWCEVRGYVAELLNTQPQPAVPEGWTIRLQADGRIYFSAPSGARGSIKRRLPKDDEPISDSTLDRAFFDLCSDLLSTPTTPQADGWVYAEPKEGQTAIAVLRGEALKMTFHGGEWQRYGSSGVCCYPPKEVTCWMPFPQPPAGQEGE